MKTIILSILFLAVIGCTEDEVVPTLPVEETRVENKYCDDDTYRWLLQRKKDLTAQIATQTRYGVGNAVALYEELHVVNSYIVKCRFVNPDHE